MAHLHYIFELGNPCHLLSGCLRQLIGGDFEGCVICIFQAGSVQNCAGALACLGRLSLKANIFMAFRGIPPSPGPEKKLPSNLTSMPKHVIVCWSRIFSGTFRSDVAGP